MVAEKNSGLALRRQQRTIARRAWMKPRSIIWSASSSTRISTCRRSKRTLLDQVDQTARCGDEDVDTARHGLACLLVDRGAAEHDRGDRGANEVP